jgi:hypothetical protein
MPTVNSEEGPAEAGKPDSGVRGRITTTVRFTKERLADLRAAAAAAGRSLSEEVEFRVERDARADAEMQGMLAQLYDHQTQIGRHQQELRTLREKSAADKGSVAVDDERIARIVATAIATFAKGGKK